MKKREFYTEVLENCKEKLSINFSDDSLLLKALTHKSYTNENKDIVVEDNQRLEFLGDSVLSLVITEYLYNKFKDEKEGVLSKMKSALVSEKTLYEIAKELNLGAFILLGKGEDNRDSRSRPSLLADLLEAIIGASYLDNGINEAKRFILSVFSNKLLEISVNGLSKDYKTIFQERVQNKYKCPPKYITESVEANSKMPKVFLSIVYANGEEIARGYGNNKKEAEMNAAKDALNIFK